MNKKERRAIESKVLPDVSGLGQITKEQLLRESEQYDKDNHDPLADIADKVVIRPSKKEGSSLYTSAGRKIVSSNQGIYRQGLKQQDI